MISTGEHQWKFLQDLSRLIQWVATHRPEWRLSGGELWRDKRWQVWLKEHGLSWTLNSKHLDRMAIDLNLFVRDGDGWRWCSGGDEPEWAVLGSVWESLSLWNRWGGRFGDANHFERRKEIRTEPDLPRTA